MAYAAPVSVKGDARSQAPSSDEAVFRRLLSACDRYAGLGFAGFVLLHCACQAWRAHGDGALPQAGLELQPASVVSLLVAVWLPFAVFTWRKLRRGIEARTARDLPERARALAVLEPLTLWVVVLFTALHVAHFVWPLLTGAFAPSDVRPELVARLSSTQHGVPLLAASYVCGVGAAAFFGARQALRALGASPRRAAVRALIALGVLAYLLGSYAVIRCASGTLLP